MELQQNNAEHVQNGTAKETIKVPQNGTDPKKDSNTKPEAEKAKPASVKEEKPEIPQAGSAKLDAVQVKEELLPAKPVLTLEIRLKGVTPPSDSCGRL